MSATGGGAAGSGFDAPVQAQFIGDFWRSEPGDALPNLVSDFTDIIAHRGPVAVGQGWIAGAASTILGLEVATVNRSGTDSRNAADPAYITGNIGSVASCPPVPTVPGATAGFKVLHSNQTQGIGLFYDGIKAIGSNANQDFAFQQKGSGLFSHQWENLNGGYWYFRKYATTTGNVPLTVGQGYREDRYGPVGCQLLWDEYRVVDSVNPAGTNQYNMRLQWNGTLNGGAAGAGGIMPRYSCENPAVGVGYSLFIDFNRVGNPAANTEGYKGQTGFAGGDLANAKINLFGPTMQNGGITGEQFYGFGVNSNTLRYQVSSTAAFHRFYSGNTACRALQVFSVSGTGNVTVDPAGLNNAGGFSSGLIRFGDENSNSFIAAAAQNPQQLTGGVNGLAPHPAPFADPGQLNMGTQSAIAMSIAGGNVAGIPGRSVRFAGAAGGGAQSTAQWTQAWVGAGTVAAQVTIDPLGAGSQTPDLAISFHNCGGGCSQGMRPAIVINNVNGTSPGQQFSAGSVAYYDSSRVNIVGREGASQSGIFDVVGSANARIGAGVSGANPTLTHWFQANGAALTTAVALQFITAGVSRGAFRANGQLNLSATAVPLFATDALAGAGGLVTGDIWRDALGQLHIKL